VNDSDCAYNYGWDAATEAFSPATQLTSRAATAAAPWWADVEIANSWDGTTAPNFADITNELDFLRRQGIQARVYSTCYQDGTQPDAQDRPDRTGHSQAIGAVTGGLLLAQHLSPMNLCVFGAGAAAFALPPTGQHA